jgi:HTH-type transcriptional regulator, sugar sensing transcriptional regulator
MNRRFPVLQAYLDRIGLNQKERHVYETLLTLGVAKAAEIGRRTNIPRQTAYSILESLVTKHIVDVHAHRGVRVYSANPQILLKRVRSTQDELERTYTDLQKEIPKIEALKMRPAAIPEMKYYEGTEGLKELFNDILEQHAQGAKEFRGYGVNQVGRALPGEFLASFIKKRWAHKVDTRLLIADAPDDFNITGPENTLGRRVKHINIPEQDAACYIVDDRVYIFSYIDQVGLVIHNATIAKLLTAVFDDHWNRVSQ